MIAQNHQNFLSIDLPSEAIDKKASCILEDSQGFIWFGMDIGLVKYDGYKGSIINFIPEDGSVHGFGNVTSLLEDTNGKIWIGTASRVYIYDPISETSIFLAHNKINGKAARSLSLTSDNKVLIGTQDGLLVFDLEGSFIEQYKHQPRNSNSISSRVIRCTYEDDKGNIWVGTYDKLNVINKVNKNIEHFKLQRNDSLDNSNNLILSIKPFNKDNDSILIVGTETGLCFFNTISKKFTQYSHSENKNSISNSVVKSIAKIDDQLWLGTDLGLNMFDYKEQTFYNYYHDFNNSNSINNNVIWDLLVDSQRNLWIASDAGINKVYLSSSNIQLNKFSPNSTLFKQGVSINDFSQQNNGDFWIGTQQGAFKYDNKYKTYQQFLPPKILHNKVKKVLDTKNGLIWIVTSGGLNIYDTQKKTFRKYVSKSKEKNALTTNYLTAIAQDSEGTIWIGSSNKGVFKVVEKANGDFEFVNYNHEIDDNNSLSSTAVFDIAFDKNDNVWIGTGNGINCLYISNGIFERFTDTTVYGETPRNANNLFFDKDGLLWISSYHGLYQWSPASKNFKYFENIPTNIKSSVVQNNTVYFISDNKFYYFNKNDNEVFRVPNNEIGLDNINNLNLLSDGTILLSGKMGFASFKGDDLNIEEDNTSVKLTRFSISNTEIKPYSEYNSRLILKKHIELTDSITLNYDENTFRINFTSLSYNSQKDVEYKYILEGYEKNWGILQDGQNHLNYTQVRPGKYKLKIIASNNQGLYKSKGKILFITVKPPVYLSWWALLFYLIFFILLILFYGRIISNRERDKNELQIEKLEHLKSEELIALKTRFFTNITHELKTPLTLISSPIDNLLSKKLDDATLQSLTLVKRNTDRLKKLVSQILDIRKIEAGGERLRIQKYDIVKFCNQIKNQFKEEATKRNIFLQFSSEPESLIMWFDLEKVEKILFNLLSNAFKFTPNKGTIRVSIDLQNDSNNENDKYLSISVSDTGDGISEEDQKHIFDRFQSLSSNNYTNQKGTGIGLSLIYEYAALHNGSVKIESVINVGSKFIFSLPKSKSLLQNYEIIEETQEIPTEKIEHELDQEELLLVNKNSLDSSKKEQDGLLKILIVEDDIDMREFLSIGFQSKYKVFTAEDGQDGFRIATKESPDIIVSDLMMPNVDGIELCKKLKADIRTSHIPFILLTAKSGMDNKITGIESGADDYIQKPFNLDLLTVRVKNLINQRESLRQTYLQQQKLEPSEITVNSVDEKFLDELLSKIELEMDNSDLSVKLLSEMLAISSTNLYRKIKALTGQTATEFIRNIRLKRAAQLLKNEGLNVSEVMYMVGFTHRSYFTRCFKDLFGVSPKSYGK